MTEADWVKKFEDIGALWRMNYDAPGAYAQLTSGNFSDGYINCAKIVEDPQLLAAVVAALIEKLQPKLNGEVPDFVIGPAYGAITIAHEVARQLGTRFGFTEVEYTDAGKMQVMKRFDIPKGAKVLVIEDVKMTGGSALKTIQVLEDAGVDVYPFVGFVNNWNEPELDGREVVALISGTMNVWRPGEVPKELAEREAVRPKANWDKLAR